MQSDLARRVERWEQVWRSHIQQTTKITHAADGDDDTEAQARIEQMNRDLYKGFRDMHRLVQGTDYDFLDPVTLHGRHSLYMPQGEKSPRVKAQQVWNALYGLWDLLLLDRLRNEWRIWQSEREQGSGRTPRQVAVHILKSFESLLLERWPVHVFNTLVMVGRHEDAWCFIAGVKSANVKRFPRTVAALQREAKSRGESPKDVVRGDLPAEIPLLPLERAATLTVEGTPIEIELFPPMLATTPEGIKAFNQGTVFSQDSPEAKQSRTMEGRVVKKLSKPRGEVDWGPEFELLPDTAAHTRLLAREAMAVLDGLPESERIALLLQAEKHTYKEIAELMHVKESTVKDYLKRGKAKLLNSA